MKSANYLICNGNFYKEDELLISANNRSFKYGDGFFETMKLVNGRIIFENLHFERLFSSLQTMQFEKQESFTNENLLQQIQWLAIKNNQQKLSRIRVNIFRGDGGLYEPDNKPNYIIQSSSLPLFPSYNEQGFKVDIYQGMRKAADAFSHIKTNNYLPYAMAALWSRQKGFDDALILNSSDRIAEATTSNLFIIKQGKLKTPDLAEGCIAGVTRRYLLHYFAEEKIACEEGKLTIDELITADEIFLTNTGWHIQWVKQCGNKNYVNTISKKLYQQFIIPLLK